MKTYKAIDEIIYEMDARNIGVRRRKPIFSLILFLTGLAMISLVFFPGWINDNSLLTNGILFAGALAVCAGVVRGIMVLRSRGTLYYIPSGSKLRRYELSFDTPYLMKVCQCVNDGDLAALTGIPNGSSSQLKAVIYKTVDNDVMLGQAMDSSKPLTEAKIFHKGSFTLNARLN